MGSWLCLAKIMNNYMVNNDQLADNQNMLKSLCTFKCLTRGDFCASVLTLLVLVFWAHTASWKEQAIFSPPSRSQEVDPGAALMPHHPRTKSLSHSNALRQTDDGHKRRAEERQRPQPCTHMGRRLSASRGRDSDRASSSQNTAREP